MKTKIISTVLLTGLIYGGINISFVAPGAAKKAQTPAKNANTSVASRVYEQVSPAVVMIRGIRARGSGFITSSNGYVVTNAHVLKGQPAVLTVHLSNGTELPADVVGFATGGVDLALLKINKSRKFPTVKLGDMRSTKVGEPVYAIGTPLGENNYNTLTDGIISGIRKNGDRIQTNAAVNPGNSGGPLVNNRGELVGVNTSGLSVAGGNIGINYAVSVNMVRKFLADVAKGKISAVATISD